MATRQSTADLSRAQGLLIKPGDHRLKHGGSYTPEYRAWQTMRLRCTVPTNPAYPDYGGRGITVCERWLSDFRNFYADMGPKPSTQHELDRKDNDKGYEPGNCRWVTRSENDRNRRSSRWVEYRGERRLLIELCEQAGVRVDTAAERLDRGWSIERALETPARAKAAKGAGTMTRRRLECGHVRNVPAGYTETRCGSCRKADDPETGVRLRKGRWLAKLKVGGKWIERGFATREEAVAARAGGRQ